MNPHPHEPGRMRLLAMFAHPDDETLSAGGILAQHVDLAWETGTAGRQVLFRKGPGEFLGAASLLERRPARMHAVAAGRVTCLALAPQQPSLHAPRGAGAWADGARPIEVREDDRGDPATTAVDVSMYIEQKLGAIRAHQTQYANAPDVIPKSILDRLFGTEHLRLVSVSLESKSAPSLVFGGDVAQEDAA